MVGQEHVVDSGIDGGDLVGEVTPNGGYLVGEVTPDPLNETPHPQEATDDRR